MLRAALLSLLLTSPSWAADAPTLAGTVTRVVDGDTIDVALSSGPIRVRLHAIDAPERNQPWGEHAAVALGKLVLGRSVDLEPHGQDQYDRLTAVVYVGDVNVNDELVRHGHAWAARRYMKKADGSLCRFEVDARQHRLGLWQLPAIAPWEWRRKRELKQFANFSGQTLEECRAQIGQRS